LSHTISLHTIDRRSSLKTGNRLLIDFALAFTPPVAAIGKRDSQGVQCAEDQGSLIFREDKAHFPPCEMIHARTASIGVLIGGVPSTATYSGPLALSTAHA
jgi:hypothetical protein